MTIEQKVGRFVLWLVGFLLGCVTTGAMFRPFLNGISGLTGIANPPDVSNVTAVLVVVTVAGLSAVAAAFTGICASYGFWQITGFTNSPRFTSTKK